MENCLVTKLKGVVENDNLLKLGELPIKMKAGRFQIVNTNGETVVRAGKPALSRTSGGTGSSSVTVPQSNSSTDYKSIYITTDCTVFVPQYYLTRISFIPDEDINIKYIGAKANLVYISIDTSDVKFDLGSVPSNAVEISSYLCTFSLDAPSYPRLQNVSAHNTNSKIYLNIPELAAKCPGLKMLSVSSSSSRITGTFEDLGICKSFNKLQFFNGTGTMEGFVAAQRVASGDRAARTTGSVSLLWCNRITFQGVGNLVQGTSKTLSWTANTITFDGTTIDA